MVSGVRRNILCLDRRTPEIRKYKKMLLFAAFVVACSARGSVVHVIGLYFAQLLVLVHLSEVVSQVDRKHGSRNVGITCLIHVVLCKFTRHISFGEEVIGTNAYIQFVIFQECSRQTEVQGIGIAVFVYRPQASAHVMTAQRKFNLGRQGEIHRSETHVGRIVYLYFRILLHVSDIGVIYLPVEVHIQPFRKRGNEAQSNV